MVLLLRLLPSSLHVTAFGSVLPIHSDSQRRYHNSGTKRPYNCHHIDHPLMATTTTTEAFDSTLPLPTTPSLSLPYSDKRVTVILPSPWTKKSTDNNSINSSGSGSRSSCSVHFSRNIGTFPNTTMTTGGQRFLSVASMNLLAPFYHALSATTETTPTTVTANINSNNSNNKQNSCCIHQFSQNQPSTKARMSTV